MPQHTLRSGEIRCDYNWEHDFNCAVNLDSGNVALFINVYVMCLFNLINYLYF